MVTKSSQLRGHTFQPDIYDRILPLLPQDKESSVLDVGAGSGFFCAKMLESGYENLTACDLPDIDFQVEEVPFHGCNLNESLPYSDDSFDRGGGAYRTPGELFLGDFQDIETWRKGDL